MNRDQHPPASDKPPLEDDHGPALIVGLGISADWLEPVAELFSHLPADTGISWVVAQSPPPHRPGLVKDRLEQHASMPVLEATEGLEPEPDQIHVLAPEQSLVVTEGAFTVTTSPQSPHGPIDRLLCTLAIERKERAVAVLFANAGPDGAVGLRAIQEQGGLTLAQRQETSHEYRLTQPAIEAGLVDHLLPPEQLAAKLLEHADYVHLSAREGAALLESQITQALGEICALVRQHTGHDFAGYKQGTLRRRIRRRLQVLHFQTLEGYLAVLKEDANEARRLVKDLLIGVTEPFRDPEAFQTLARQVVPRLAEGQAPDAPIRVWVAGCASGEEAYSIAILVHEHLEQSGSKRLAQIFATDIDGEMLDEARAGRYPATIAEQVGPARLKRFFTRDGYGYQVTKALREMCVFSQHSLIRDPPFSQLDLIVCRNVLIYFSNELQRKLLPLLHYALRPRGFLFLGPSEGLGGSSTLFETIDAASRLFRRKEVIGRLLRDFPLGGRGAVQPARRPLASAHHEPPTPTLEESVAAAFERTVLDEYADACAVVTLHGDLVRAAGRLSRYFRFSAGAVSTSLVELAPAALSTELRLALQTAASTGRRVVRDDLAVALDGDIRHLRLTVRSVPGVDADSGLLLVVVQDHSPLEPPDESEEATLLPEQPILERLESELRAARAELKDTVEALESANEELISTNEELQSANEELHASQRELQSLNTELEMVNAELRQKVDELGGANSDLQNLFASTEIATLFLDRDLRIAKVTPAAARLLQLEEGALGQSLEDLAHWLEDADLAGTAREVLSHLTPLEHQVRCADGVGWLIVRITPYRTVANGIAGVVVTFIDVSELKRIEEGLRRSEERLRLALQAAKAGTWEWDVQTGANEWSDELWSLYELSPQSGEPSYDLWQAAIHPDDHDAAVQAVRSAAAAGTDLSLEWRVDTHGGPVRWLFSRGQPRRDADGRVLGYLGIVLDITERKATEAALHESEERLRLLGDNLPDSALYQYVHEPDGQVRFLYFSAGIERLNGISADEVLRDSMTLHRQIPADCMDALTEAEAHSKRTLSDFDMEVPMRRPDGELRWMRLHSRPRRLPDGRMLWDGVQIDVTDRKMAEEALLQSREGLRRLADASLAVMAKTDLHDMLQAVSEAALALTGARLATCGHGLVSGQAIVGGLARAPGAPACPPGEMFQLDKGGVHMAVAEGAASIRLTDAQLRAHAKWWGLPAEHVALRGLLGVPMRARNGKTNGMILVTDKARGDFTAEDEALLRQLGTVASLALQHVEARLALEALDQRKNEFLAMLGHELRNPLAPIRNSLYVLDHTPPGGELAVRAQSVIDRQVTHLTRLVDDLLDVTRISRGKIQLKREQLDLGELLERTVDDYRDDFSQGKIVLELALPQDVLWVDADRTRMMQVIGNLLTNALKFTPPGGKTSISLEHNPDLGQAVLRVRDTGIGIAPEMLSQVFEAFVQADTTLDRARGGLGLGLAMVKGLIEMHDGTTTLKSAGPDQGTEVSVHLPLAWTESPSQPANGQAGHGGSQRYVLIIEDNRDAAESLRMLLELSGHKVEIAFSGPEGVAKARQQAPDVILCDIGLPGMDGYAVARALRKEPGLRTTRLVALSGYAAAEDAAKARDAGFDAHFAKPLALDELQEALYAPGRGRG